MPTPLAHPRSDTDDAELARRAASGDGHAFAALYDRHERRVYGFCLRMLGSPHDAADATQETFVRMLARLPALAGRELNPVAYALAAARNVCYDAIEARGRTRPLIDGDGGEAGGGEPMPRDEELSRDPERSALLAAGREQVRVANGQLPPRQREVLALREVEQLSYEQIGELMGLNRNAVAQLISRARIGLRALVRGEALTAIAATGADCERALPLLAAAQDDEAGAGAELVWLREHVSACETCRASQAAMQEAGASYRLLAPVVPLAWLRHATIARAAEHVGADWSEVVGASSEAGPHTSGGPSGRPTSGRRTDGGGVRFRSRFGAATATRGGGRSRRRAVLRVSSLLLLLCLLLAALVGATRDGRVLAPSAARLPTGAPTRPRVALRAQSAKRRGAVRRASVVTPPSGRGTPTAQTTAVAPARPVGVRRVASTRRRRTKHVSTTRHPARPPAKPTTPQPAPVSTTPPPSAPTTSTPAPPPPTTTAPPTTSTPTPTPPPETPPETPGRPAPPGFVP